MPNAAALHTNIYPAQTKRVLTFLAAFALGSASARAEVLQRLSITILTETADHNVVPIGANFHLKIHAHITQAISHLDNLTLPPLVEFDETGDERHIKPATGGGTDYDEVLTLSPKHAGDIEIRPVTIDAINTLTNQPSKFASTDLVVIHAKAPAAPKNTLSAVTLARFGAIAAISVGMAFLVFQIGGMLIVWFTDTFGRNRKPRSVAPPSAPPRQSVALPSGTPVQRLRHAITMIADNPSAAYAEELRSALRDALGATEGETLADIVARIPVADRGVLGRALRAAERAAFIDTASRRSAIEDGLPIFDLACRHLEK